MVSQNNRYIGFKSWLRQIISSNIYLYSVWFYGVRKFKGDNVRLPSVEDDFYFDGYPRSGNTFFANFLKEVYSSKKFAHHLHVISGLKIALNLELLIFIIIRKPKDAIISNLYRKVFKKNIPPNQYLIEDLLVSYYNYYSFTKRHISSINILKFNSCINNEISVAQKVAEVAGFNPKSESSLQETLNNYQSRMKRMETEKNSSISSLPNSHREKFKNKYLHKVLNSPSYGMVENIYDELIEYDLLSGEFEAKSSI